MRKPISGRPQMGFTILELMSTIAVLGILLGLGVPMFFEIINNNRTIAQANNLVSALNYARSEAVKRGDPVSVCSSTDSSTCAADTDWSTGFIAFTDATGVAGTRDVGDVVLQAWGATEGLQLDSGANAVRFRATGMAATAVVFGLQKEGCKGDRARQIEVFAAGRIRTTTVECS